MSLLITRQNISKFFFPCMPEIRLSIRNKNPAYCLPKLETTFWVGPFWPGNDQKIAGKQCLWQNFQDWMGWEERRAYSHFPGVIKSKLKMIIDRSIILNKTIMSVGDSSYHQQSYSGLHLHIQLYSVYLEDHVLYKTIMTQTINETLFHDKLYMTTWLLMYLVPWWAW